MSDHPESDFEEVIDRLSLELRQSREFVFKIKQIVYSRGEFQGMSLLGAITAMQKKYLDAQDRIFELEQEIETLWRKK